MLLPEPELPMMTARIRGEIIVPRYALVSRGFAGWRKFLPACLVGTLNFIASFRRSMVAVRYMNILLVIKDGKGRRMQWITGVI